jgi:hypothetical protein
MDGLTSVTESSRGALMYDGIDDQYLSHRDADDILGESVSEGDLASAGILVESFLAGPPDEFELEPDLAVSDIEADATEFEAELDLLEQVGADVPALPLGDGAVVPVALRAVAGPSWPGDPLERPLAPGQRQFDPETASYLRWLIERGELTTEYGRITSDEARITFFQRARESLARRIAAVRGPCSLLRW